MKVFDFSHEDFGHCEPKKNFIKDSYQKSISEQEFVDALQSMPKHDRWTKGHSPSAAKYEYRCLVEKFGLFQPNAKAKGI